MPRPDRTDDDMTPPSLHSNHFILEAFACDWWCPIAQTLLHVADIASLRAILGAASDEDPELHHTYHLDNEDLAALTARFGVELDRSLLEATNLIIRLYRWRRIYEVQSVRHAVRQRRRDKQPD
jgi:hypothetical protein